MARNRTVCTHLLRTSLYGASLPLCIAETRNLQRTQMQRFRKKITVIFCHISSFSKLLFLPRKELLLGVREHFVEGAKRGAELLSEQRNVLGESFHTILKHTRKILTNSYQLPTGGGDTQK